MKGKNNSDNRTTTNGQLSSQQVIREHLQQLIQQLEAGHSEVLTAFLHAVALFRHYSFGNVLMIATQKPEATRVAGIVTWNRLGRRVKRGVKGIAILAPMVVNRRDKKENTNDESREEKKTVVVGFRRVYVWDVAQTEGEALPSLGEATGEVGESLDRLREFIAGKGIALEYDEGIAPAQGMSYGGRIALLPGQTKAEEFATLVHETAHEMLHKADRRAATTKTIRETEAEAVAFVVGKAVGLNVSSSVDYIQLYHGDAELLQESLEIVHQTAAQILAAVQEKVATTESAISMESRSVLVAAVSWKHTIGKGTRNRHVPFGVFPATLASYSAVSTSNPRSLSE